MSTNSEMRLEIEKALHVDWAFKDVNGKPDKIIVEGYPKGAYHTSYETFVDNMEALIEQLLDEARIDELIRLMDIFPWDDQDGETVIPRSAIASRIKELQAKLNKGAK